MRLAIETFVCAILISLLVLLGMFNQQVDMNTGNAKQFCSSAINRMESAEFANEVVDRCKSDATASGYRLTVTSAASGDTTTYTTVLTYKVKVPLFQFEREYQIKQAAEVNYLMTKVTSLQRFMMKDHAQTSDRRSRSGSGNR